MKNWMKWAILAALLVALVVGVIVANKLGNKPVGDVETTAPSTAATVFTEDDEVLRQTTFEEYNAWSQEEKIAFKDAFSSPKAYTKWYNEAKRIYDAQGVTVLGTDQTIDIGDIIGSEQ